MVVSVKHEYPEGRYCYFLTVDNFGNGVYPYILGTSFYSVPAENNFSLEFDQSNDSNIPSAARRIRTSNTPTKGFDSSLVVGSIARGSIDSFDVVALETHIKITTSFISITMELRVLGSLEGFLN